MASAGPKSLHQAAADVQWFDAEIFAMLVGDAHVIKHRGIL